MIRWRGLTLARCALMLGGLVLCFGLRVVRAQAAFPGANGVITFALNNSDDGGNGEIDTVSAAGRGLKTIYSEGYGGSGQLDPSYSPDGARLVFDTNGQGPLGIPADGSYIQAMNSDGSGLSSVPSQNGAEPAWGPDGHSIVYADAAGLVTLDLPTGASRLVAGPGASEPAWSTRNQIAYVSHGDIYRVAAAGGVPVRLTFKGGRQPTFFPGGGRLAFVRNIANRGQIFTMAADGSHPRQITDMKRRSTSPTVSPDGRSIAFIHDSGPAENSRNTDRLWTMHAGGSRQQPVGHLPDSDFGLVQFEHPNWQPRP
jgi:Tol biopolymer transport system component